MWVSVVCVLLVSQCLVAFTESGAESVKNVSESFKGFGLRIKKNISLENKTTASPAFDEGNNENERIKDRSAQLRTEELHHFCEHCNQQEHTEEKSGSYDSAPSSDRDGFRTNVTSFSEAHASKLQGQFGFGGNVESISDYNSHLQDQNSFVINVPNDAENNCAKLGTGYSIPNNHKCNSDHLHPRHQESEYYSSIPSGIVGNPSPFTIQQQESDHKNEIQHNDYNYLPQHQDQNYETKQQNQNYDNQQQQENNYSPQENFPNVYHNPKEWPINKQDESSDSGWNFISKPFQPSPMIESGFDNEWRAIEGINQGYVEQNQVHTNTNYDLGINQPQMSKFQYPVENQNNFNQNAEEKRTHPTLDKNQMSKDIGQMPTSYQAFQHHRQDNVVTPMKNIPFQYRYDNDKVPFAMQVPLNTLDKNQMSKDIGQMPTSYQAFQHHRQDNVVTPMKNIPFQYRYDNDKVPFAMQVPLNTLMPPYIGDVPKTNTDFIEKKVPHNVKEFGHLYPPDRLPFFQQLGRRASYSLEKHMPYVNNARTGQYPTVHHPPNKPGFFTKEKKLMYAVKIPVVKHRPASVPKPYKIPLYTVESAPFSHAVGLLRSNKVNNAGVSNLHNGAVGNQISPWRMQYQNVQNGPVNMYPSNTYNNPWKSRPQNLKPPPTIGHNYPWDSTLSGNSPEYLNLGPHDNNNGGVSSFQNNVDESQTGSWGVQDHNIQDHLIQIPDVNTYNSPWNSRLQNTQDHHQKLPLVTIPSAPWATTQFGQSSEYLNHKSLDNNDGGVNSVQNNADGSQTGSWGVQDHNIHPIKISDLNTYNTPWKSRLQNIQDHDQKLPLVTSLNSPWATTQFGQSSEYLNRKSLDNNDGGINSVKNNADGSQIGSWGVQDHNIHPINIPDSNTYNTDWNSKFQNTQDHDPKLPLVTSHSTPWATTQLGQSSEYLKHKSLDNNDGGVNNFDNDAVRSQTSSLEVQNHNAYSHPTKMSQYNTYVTPWNNIPQNSQIFDLKPPQMRNPNNPWDTTKSGQSPEYLNHKTLDNNNGEVNSFHNNAVGSQTNLWGVQNHDTHNHPDPTKTSEGSTFNTVWNSRSQSTQSIELEPSLVTRVSNPWATTQVEKSSELLNLKLIDNNDRGINSFHNDAIGSQTSSWGEQDHPIQMSEGNTFNTPWNSRLQNTQGVDQKPPLSLSNHQWETTHDGQSTDYLNPKSPSSTYNAPLPLTLHNSKDNPSSTPHSVTHQNTISPSEVQQILEHIGLKSIINSVSEPSNSHT